MRDLISREAAKAAIREKFPDLTSRVEINTVLNGIPAVDAVPNGRGHWTTKRTTEHDGEWYCDVCGYEPMVFENSRFCPGCGALMQDSACGPDYCEIEG